MLVTLVGMMTLVNPAQLQNTSPPMLVTPSGMVKLPTLPLGHWMSVVWFLSHKTPSTLLKAVLSGSTVIAVRLVHAANAEVPMLPMLEGMVMLASLLQLENA